MNLLLLLSALLSALTGVGASTRGVEPAAAVSQAAVATAAVRAVRVTTRPVTAIPRRIALVRLALPAFPRTGAALFLSRLRV